MSQTSPRRDVSALRQARGEGDDQELDTAIRDLASLHRAVAEIKDHDRRTGTRKWCAPLA